MIFLLMAWVGSFPGTCVWLEKLSPSMGRGDFFVFCNLSPSGAHFDHFGKNPPDSTLS